MGYLAFGAMAGVGKEWLKQSDEKRANKYQELRDNRLAELTTKENIRSEGVRAAEAATERDFRSTEAKTKREAEDARAKADRESREAIAGMEGDYTLGRGQQRYDADGNLIASGPEYTHAPTAASLASDKWRQQSVGIRGEGGQEVGRESRENLYKEWEGQAYSTTTDDLGNKIITRNEGVAGWDDWLNSRVIDEDRVAPLDAQNTQGRPMELLMYLQTKPEYLQPGGHERAIEMIQRMHPWWKPPQLEETAQSKPVPAGDQTPQAGPPGTQPQPGWQPTSPTQETGMLSQGQGQMVESSRDIQAQIDLIKRQIVNSQGRLGDPSRVPALQQQLQQYEQLLQRALQQEAMTQSKTAGPASIAGNRPQAPATQVAQR